MKKYVSLLKITFVSVLLLMQFTTSVVAGDDNKPGIWIRSLTLEQAIQAAKKENKKVYVHGYADWCHYCTYMKDSVYTDKEVGDFFNENFVSIKIDYEKEGREMNRTLKIHTFPTMLFYDTNGELMHRAAGRRYKQPFMELGREAIDPKRQMRTFKTKYNDETASPYEVQFYFRMQEIAGMDAQPMINEYLTKQTDADLLTPNNWRIIYDIVKDPYLPVMSRVLSNKKEFEKTYTADSINSKLISLYNTRLMQFVQKLDSVGYEAEKKKIKNTKGLNIADKICAWADLNKLKMESDWVNYKTEGKLFLEKYAMDDNRRLTEVSQVYYERFNSDKAALAEAEQWVLKAVSLSDSYKANHLLASISVLMNKKEQALNAANHAIEVGKKTSSDYRQTNVLLERIQSMP